MGRFFGFKLHLIINEIGEIISFSLTPGNVDDRNQYVMKKLTKKCMENYLEIKDTYQKHFVTLYFKTESN